MSCADSRASVACTNSSVRQCSWHNRRYSHQVHDCLEFMKPCLQVIRGVLWEIVTSSVAMDTASWIDKDLYLEEISHYRGSSHNHDTYIYLYVYIYIYH